ncbi:SDR family NAD(P)-dependent oxidoreductase [Profundibacterium mesophilum]|uniref:3-oxoacyl-acyl-carrier protein reductase n=1 Tax=Profundibacterium mesophilum KAUST100406-0324 TaxID=1037889 RepID=A0A921NUX0_9RHOB|nr:SDR family oxidoreductase [Profundibacterium mesophilum]KAF0675716.1 3-oxoacyl-acyl-carrier protein reductase [Profundibacterium mesophilum KAUST100406-0324]
MSFAITGKTAIVTGAATGVGLAIARHFIDQGANVMMADIDEDRLAQELGVLGEDEGSVRSFGGDLREKLTIANLLSATIDAFDRIDILVNATQHMILSDPLDAEDDSITTLLSQNLMTSVRLSQQVAKRMIRQAENDGQKSGPVGTIINLSSIAARRTSPELLGFSVSSAALDQATRSMAVALAPHRIRVNAIACGSVMSGSLRGAIKEQSGLREEIIENTPLARIASAGEVAATAQFLAADGSGFMTGQILTIDGGRTLVDVVESAAH